MSTVRSALFHAFAWIAARHVAHFEAQVALSGMIGAFAMRLAHPKLFNHYAESMEQHEELQELKALSAAFDIKEMAKSDDGWEGHHGIGLEMIASILIDQHDWEPEDVSEFIEELTEGELMYALSDDSEDDDDDN